MPERILEAVGAAVTLVSFVPADAVSGFLDGVHAPLVILRIAILLTLPALCLFLPHYLN